MTRGGHELLAVLVYKYLGVILTPTLSWTLLHLHDICSSQRVMQTRISHLLSFSAENYLPCSVQKGVMVGWPSGSLCAGVLMEVGWPDADTVSSLSVGRTSSHCPIPGVPGTWYTIPRLCFVLCSSFGALCPDAAGLFSGSPPCRVRRWFDNNVRGRLDHVRLLASASTLTLVHSLSVICDDNLRSWCSVYGRGSSSVHVLGWVVAMGP